MDLDVLVVGAGISGINAAYRIQSQFPNTRYAVLEARSSVGGTWDLFRYPGIRSDSDLFTFGFPWNPWNQPQPIAEGSAILQYIKQSAAQTGVDQHIRFHHQVTAADWSSEHQRWTLSVELQRPQQQPQQLQLTTRFLVWSTGYYNYHQPLPADIPGLERFQGQTIHPQFWPEQLDYRGKKIVIIGSGATAVTLLPTLAQQAAHTTMLQRSPTYIVSVPNGSARAWYSRWLPDGLYRRWKRYSWILTARLFFLVCQTFPGFMKRALRRRASEQLPARIPVDPHFTPRYNPWDQRVCFSPDGDFYQSLRDGTADVKTDTIRQVVGHGIELASGETLPADIIITATGLQLEMSGAARVAVDGRPIHPPDHYVWRSMMLNDVPNSVFIIGYTNASWTLGADATARFICRLLHLLRARRASSVVPRLDGPVQPVRLMNLQSTYMTRAESALPKAGDRAPWRPRESYYADSLFVDYGDVTGALEFCPEHPKSE